MKNRYTLLAAAAALVFFATIADWRLVQVGTGQFSHVPTALAGAENGTSQAEAILAAYKQIEQAVQTVNADLYLSLQSQKKLGERLNAGSQEQFRKIFRADPSVRYEVLGVRTRDDHGAVLGRITDSTNIPPQYIW